MCSKSANAEKGVIMQLKKSLLFIPTVVVAMAFMSCGSKTKDDIRVQNQTEVSKYNENVLKTYAKKVQADSIAMVEALKGLNGIDFKTLEKNYNLASARRSVVYNQINVAQKDNKPNIAAEKEKLLQKVKDQTQADVDAYQNALNRKHLAEGSEYIQSRNILNNLEQYAISATRQGVPLTYDYVDYFGGNKKLKDAILEIEQRQTAYEQ